MKNWSLFLAAASLVLAGCGEDKKKETTPAPQPSQSAPANTASDNAIGALDAAKQTGQQIADQAKETYNQTKDQAKAAATEVKQQVKDAANQTSDQAKAAVTDAKTQAKASVDDAKTQGKQALADLKEQAKASLTPPSTGATTSASSIEAVKTESEAIIKQITDTASKLSTSANDTIKEQISKLTSGVQSGDDTESTGALQKIMAAKPSDAQMTMVSEIRSNVAVLALGRSFENADPAATGVVNKAITAIKGGNSTEIVSSLQQIGTQVKLTDPQKEIVSSLAGSWNSKLASASESVNKAFDAAKSLGLQLGGDTAKQ